MAGEQERTRMMFLYWGRRGALPQLTLEAAHAALANPRIAATISVSRQVENFVAFASVGPALFAIDTFHSNASALLRSWRIPLLRRQLHQRLCQDRTQVVVELMPHIWSPLVMPVVRAAGALYYTIVHDAQTHPGDSTGWVRGFADRSAQSADLVLTLSAAVAAQLSAAAVPKSKLVTLFHPDLMYGTRHAHEPPSPGEPLRLLFLGRIMPYKNLPLFLDMVDLLRRDGIAVYVGVFGEGSLGSNAERLQLLGAEVINRWLSEAEIAAILPRFHALVLSHTEASQSGVAATAFGAGLPVIATPVGGLTEQVIDGVNGMLALRADAPALAEAAKRLLLEPQTYGAIGQNIVRMRAQRSMAKFVDDIVTHARKGKPILSGCAGE